MASVKWKLREYLDAHNLTTYQLAKEVGGRESTIYRLTRAERPDRLDLSTLGRILSALQRLTKNEVSINDVIEVEGIKQKSRGASLQKIKEGSTSKPSAFVIMPFKPDYNAVFESIIKIGLEQAGYEVSRADSLPDQRNILKKIIEGIANADLVVADLSEGNENVFYELGICHGLNIDTLLITQDRGRIPFDLRSYVISEYSRDFAKVGHTISFLREIAQKKLENKVRFENPVVDFWPKGEDSGSKILNETSKGDNDIADELGFLDYYRDFETSSKNLTKITEDMIHEIEFIGERTQENANRINILVEKNRGNISSTQAFMLLEESAKDISLFAEKMDFFGEMYNEYITQYQNSYQGYINHYIETKDIEAIESQLLASSRLTSSLNESLQGLSQMREAVFRLPKMTSGFISARKRAVNAIDKVMGYLRNLRDYSEEINSDMQEKIAEYS